jgi:hypothetical protein
MMQQQGAETTEESSPPEQRLPRYVTPITADIRMVAFALIGVAAALAASGLLNWFTSTIPPNGTNTYAPQTFSAYHFGWASAWFASVSAGWVLLAVALVLVAFATMILRTQRAVWLFRASVGACLLSAAVAVLVLVERTHVSRQIPLDLRRSTAKLLEINPEAKAIVEKQLAGLTVSEGVGVWVALAAAVACAVIAILIAMKSRRPSEATSS